VCHKGEQAGDCGPDDGALVVQHLARQQPDSPTHQGALHTFQGWRAGGRGGGVTTKHQQIQSVDQCLEMGQILRELKSLYLTCQTGSLATLSTDGSDSMNSNNCDVKKFNTASLLC
jgi:hypothetical protein